MTEIPKKKKNSTKELDNAIRIKMNIQYDNMYVDEQQQRLKLKKANGIIVILCIAFVVLFLFSVLAVTNIGVNWMSFAWILDVIKIRFQALISWFSGESYVNAIDQMVYRYILIAVAGSALAVCGAVYQGTFKNAMASPSTLGVQSGGTLGAVLYILFFYESKMQITKPTNMSELIDKYNAQNILEHNEQQLLTLLGCALGVFFTVTVAKAAGRGKINTVALIIAGTVFSSLIGSFSSFIQYFFLLTDTSSEKTEMLRYILMGTFDNVNSFEDIVLMGIPAVFLIIVLILLRSKLNVLVFGEDEAKAMGLRVGLYRGILVTICTILTALILSFCGHIGFVGLMVPHITRFLVGPDFKVLIPATAISGAVMMLLIYDIAYITGYASYIGLITSIVGAITFGTIMLVNRRKRNADWT